jgi:hypothetical protein
LKGFVPGIPGASGKFYFWLSPIGKYIVGGNLSVYTKDGTQVKSILIPKNREKNIIFQKETKYGSWYIPIIGTDAKDNIYLLTEEKKEIPIVIKKVHNAEYTINYDNIILKVNLDGEVCKIYKTPGPIIDLGMKKQIQVTPDGSIYYWKYFIDRMELWRILPE